MVEIIPKQVKKTLPWQNFLLYASLGLLVAAILSYSILMFSENKASVSLLELEEEILKAGTPEEKALEVKVLSLDKKIKAFAVLLSTYQRPSNFFKSLEELSHPKTWFSRLELYPETRKAVISGKTPNFQTLGQQLIILQSQDLFKDINLSNLSLGKEGEVEFTFNLSLSPQLFK